MYSLRLPGLVRGRLHSAISRAMKPLSGSASLAHKLVHLVGLGEVVHRLERIVSVRLITEVGQVEGRVSDRS